MISYPTLINPTQIRIGWIATDVMGSAMSSRLLSAVYFVTIYVRDPYKVVHLQSQGALLANSPTDLWSTDVSFTMLGYPSDVRVQDNILPLEDSRRAPQEHMVYDQMEFLAKNSNFGKNDEEMIQGKSLDKLPCIESFQKEQVGFHDTHQGTLTLEGTTSPTWIGMVQDNILSLEDSRRALQEHMVYYQMEFLAKNSNFGKNDEEMIQGKSLYKLPCIESFQKEQVGFHDTHQSEYLTLHELQSNNDISYTPINLEYYGVASSSQVNVFGGLPKYFHEPFLCDTLGIARLHED
ncbi:putative 3-hydroxyisobutyrate dehydrogenase-like 3, mitochondrial [Capsicum baccatum]|uniref:3-hydroxyisobutyrate dehydrogenase-like 3, mitochondrial n=1 Tax=Capsicum baccatum TaxID=33114 RepID=A0A2G2XSV9_CAPBA|nr:putative 3-hydroxyisobutyrate dehydrogenase-like 3, mitochondrial [Capsicum baccatum]